MSENTYEILESKSLQTRRTKKLANELAEVVSRLDQAIKFQLLPLENEILSRSNSNTLTEELMVKAGSFVLQINSEKYS